MRIASFNLENLTDAADCEAPLDQRAEILRPQLERLRADILCLQEVDATRLGNSGPRRHHALELLLEDTDYKDFHLATTTESEKGWPRDKHNLVTLSRWPIKQKAQYLNDLVMPPRWQSITALPPDNERKPVTWDRPLLHCVIELKQGRILHVINMHLRAPLAAPVRGQKSGPFAWRSAGAWAEGYYLAAMKRAGQAFEARLLLERIFEEDPKALIAVVGDLNSEEREVPMKILLADQEDTGNGRLAGHSLIALEHSLPEDRRFTVIHRGRKLMLDHLLVSRQLLGRYRGLEVHNEALGDELVAYSLIDAAPDSYHAPVVAEFEI